MENLIKEDYDFPLKIFIFTILVTLLFISPLTNYFLHYDPYQFLFLTLLLPTQQVYFLFSNPIPISQYPFSAIDLILIHLVLSFAALVSAALFWALLTKHKVQEKLGVRSGKTMLPQNLLPFIVFSISLPTISVATLLFKAGLLGLGPTTHFCVQAVILTIVVGWLFATYTRPSEVISETGLKNIRIILLIATIVALAAVFVIGNIYSGLEIPRDIFKVIYPSIWLIFAQTIPLLNFPSSQKFIFVWISIILYYFVIVHNLNSYLYELTVKEPPILEPTVRDWESLMDNLGEDEREYLKEAIGCLRHGFYKAAVVLAWSAAVHRMHKVIEKLGFDEFNKKTSEMKNIKTGRFKKFNKEFHIHSISDLRATVFDTDLLWVLEYMNYIDANQHQRLSNCFVMRNNCAHPGEAKVTPKNLISFYSDLKKFIFDNEKFKI